MMAMTTSSSIKVKAVIFVRGRSPARLTLQSNNILRVMSQNPVEGASPCWDMVKVSQLSLGLSWHMNWPPCNKWPTFRL